MGIRLYRTAGYGLKFDQDNYDTRMSFKMNGGWDDLEERMEGSTMRDLIAHMKLHHPDERQTDRHVLSSMINNGKLNEDDTLERSMHLIHNGDNYLGLLLQPPYETDWHERAGTLDYLRMGHDPDDNSFMKEIESGIYPHIDQMHAKTGEKVVDLEDTTATLGKMNMNLEVKWGGDEQAQRYGFKDIADFQENCVPRPPLIVRAMFELTEVLKDPSMIRHVRPYYSEYWS